MNSRCSEICFFLKLLILLCQKLKLTLFFQSLVKRKWAVTVMKNGWTGKIELKQFILRLKDRPLSSNCFHSRSCVHDSSDRPLWFDHFIRENHMNLVPVPIWECQERTQVHKDWWIFYRTTFWIDPRSRPSGNLTGRQRFHGQTPQFFYDPRWPTSLYNEKRSNIFFKTHFRSDKKSMKMVKTLLNVKWLISTSVKSWHHSDYDVIIRDVTTQVIKWPF